VLAESAKNGEVQVKALSALAELKLRSADLLLSGKLLQEVCAECVPEVLRPDLLVTKDVDGLFCFLVIATYGSKKKVSAAHDCDNAKFHEHEVDVETIVHAPHNEVLDHRQLLYFTELPNGQRVHLKPMTFERKIESMNLESAMTQKEFNKIKVEQAEVEQFVVHQLISMIDKVIDGDVEVKDAKLIEEWIRVIPRKFTQQIFEAFNKAQDWGFSFQFDLPCPDCKKSFKFDLELNPITFFSG
jgi:hypothetical protein